MIWLAYPLAYLIFAQACGSFSGDYLYPFLDLAALGIGGLSGPYFAIMTTQILFDGNIVTWDCTEVLREPIVRVPGLKLQGKDGLPVTVN